MMKPTEHRESEPLEQPARKKRDGGGLSWLLRAAMMLAMSAAAGGVGASSPSPTFFTLDDDASLVAALRGGDPRAYEFAVREYGPRILVITRRILNDEQDAMDAVQEAFLAAFRSIDRFSAEARFSTWLHRIAVNAALMKLRAKRSRPELAIEDLLPRFLDDGHHADWPEPWSRHDSPAEIAETQAIVRDGIDQLPLPYRAVIQLRDLEGRSTEETATLLGDSVNAVKIRLHRARQALRGILDKRFRTSLAS